MSARTFTDSPRPGFSLRERNGVCHQPLRDNDEEATWTPIACGGGISYPGSQGREPVTCPQCLAVAAGLAAPATGFAPATAMPARRRTPSRRHTLTDADYAA